MHALAHWCGHVSAIDDLAVAMGATNYAVEGATGEFSCMFAGRYLRAHIPRTYPQIGHALASRARALR